MKRQSTPIRRDVSLLYRGSLKHKDWQPGGGYGTVCPKWTHATEAQGFRGVTETHPWPDTSAQRMLETSILAEEGRRFAASNGIAFRADPSGDGTWHGYPLGWDEVPLGIQERLVQAGQATWREIRRQKTVKTGDLRWALKSDE
jgi:hypothetical protein